MKRTFLLFLLFFILMIEAYGCTTAVISGRFTPDGKPLLWKHRDTWAVNNKIMKFTDGKYSYMGLVNSQDKEGESIWIGLNSEGFAIMNSASYNLNNDSVKQSGHEGRLMKRALQECKNIDEFEALLKTLDLPSKLEANFGVIDAEGGAAFFEFGNFSYEKFDANDPKQAPYGYLIRTNHSMSGELGIGGGYIRFDATEEVFKMAVRENRMTPRTIIQEGSRNTYHPLTKTDMMDYKNNPANREKLISFTDYVPRKSTSSSIVIQGVKEGMSADQCIMWTVLGWPMSSLTIPLWLSCEELPEIVEFDEKIGDAPLCNLALQLKKRAFPYEWGYSHKYYIDVNALINDEGSGILQLITELENLLFLKYEAFLQINEETISCEAIEELYQETERTILQNYEQIFGLTPKEISKND